MRKYITMTRGRKPTTALTPPMMPSVSSAARKGSASAFASRPAAQSLKASIRVTRPGMVVPFSNSKPSAIQGPSQAWLIWNTRNITAAKISSPTTGRVSSASTLSWTFSTLVRIFRFSTLATISFTKAKRLRSAESTASLSVRSTSPGSYGAFWLPPTRAAAATT